MLWPSLEEQEFDVTTDRGSGLSCLVQSIAVQDAKRLLLGMMFVGAGDSVDCCPLVGVTVTVSVSVGDGSWQCR